MTLEERVEELERITGAITEALNDKTDRDARNLSGGGKTLISGLGMPSSRYIVLTLGASGSSYTAPANGYVCISGAATGDSYVALVSNEVRSQATETKIGYGIRCFIPVKSGGIFNYEYQNLNGGLKFIYAEGEE